MRSYLLIVLMILARHPRNRNPGWRRGDEATESEPSEGSNTS